VLTQIQTVFVQGTAATLGRGLARGLRLVFAQPNLLYLLGVLVLTALLFFHAMSVRRREARVWAALLAGAFLFVAPLLLFFVLKAPWFGFRNAVFSFCGLALMADALFDMVFGASKRGRPLQAALLAGFVLLCSLASVSELHDYRQTTEADSKAAKAAVAAVVQNGDTATEIWLLNVHPSYVKNASIYYHEHGYGVTASAWAMTGAITALGGGEAGISATFTPVSPHTTVPADREQLENASAYWYTGKAFVPVTLVQTGEETWAARAEDGDTLGLLRYADGGLSQYP